VRVLQQTSRCTPSNYSTEPRAAKVSLHALNPPSRQR
jgi:hypothetical protein